MKWAALVLLAACGSKGGPSSRDAVVDAWKKAGLVVSDFTKASTDVGKDCALGTVNRVEVLVCSYGSADDAKKSEDFGLKWVGDTTGMSQARGTLVIAAADRKKADPNGKTINQIFKLVPQ